MHIKFVNRIEELNALAKFSSKFRGLPLYIYGPEGCGKTRLLREFVSKFNEYYGKEAIAIYIDALERESIDKAIFVPKSVKLVKTILTSIVEHYGGVVGKALINSISTILEKTLTDRKLEDNYIMVVVDDVVKAIGLEKIEWYVKWLYELLWKLFEEHNPRAINFIILTSEGKSLDLISRHRHVSITLLWNLEKNAFKELFYKLNPPENVCFENVWQLFGGNPGKLVELAIRYDWALKSIIDTYRDTLEQIVREIIGHGLKKELELVLEDVDSIYEKPNKRMLELKEMLVERNLIIYKKRKDLCERYVKINQELGIGKYFAWQVPMYRIIMRNILSAQTSNII